MFIFFFQQKKFVLTCTHSQFIYTMIRSRLIFHPEQCRVCMQLKHDILSLQRLTQITIKKIDSDVT